METIGLPTVDGWALAITLIFVLFDVLTGIVKAGYRGEFSSTGMRQGIYHKASYLCVLALAFLCDWGIAHIDLGFAANLTPIVCAYISLTEITSILENLAAVNPSLAGSRIMRVFEQPNDGEEGED